MSTIEPNWPQLLVFLPAWLIGCVGFFYLVGNLPVSAAPPPVQTGAGPALVWLNLVVVAALCVTTIVFALMTLRWTTLVVAGGMVFLFAPFIVQDLPRLLRDTRLGLAVLLGLASACLLVVGLSL